MICSSLALRYGDDLYEWSSSPKNCNCDMPWNLRLKVNIAIITRPTSDWAISLSWWGKARSTPPEWISKPSPRIAVAMTEHSICQPGRPGPQGDGHEGSPGFEAFQSAKSATDRWPVLFDKVPAASINQYCDNSQRLGDDYLPLPPGGRGCFCSMVQVLRSHGHPIYQMPKC